MQQRKRIIKDISDLLKGISGELAHKGKMDYYNNQYVFYTLTDDNYQITACQVMIKDNEILIEAAPETLWGGEVIKIDGFVQNKWRCSLSDPDSFDKTRQKIQECIDYVT